VKGSGGGTGTPAVSTSVGKLKPSNQMQSKPFREGTCARCGNYGHFKKSCTIATTNREMAAIVESEVKESEDDYDSDSEYAHVCIGSGCIDEEVAMVGDDTRANRLAAMHRYEVGLDSMCSCHIFGESTLLSNIRECKPRVFNGLAGSTSVSLIGTHIHFGDIYYHPRVPNLLSLGNIEKNVNCSVEYTNGEFNVWFGDKGYSFENRRGRNLYLCDFSAVLEEHTSSKSVAYLARGDIDVDDDILPELIDESDDEDDDLSTVSPPGVSVESSGVETVDKNITLYTKKQVAQREQQGLSQLL
jgi:hypothetical protein